MNSPDNSAPDPIRDGYEAARLANLLHFASLTPGERVEWLAHALELYEAIQSERTERTARQGRMGTDSKA